MHPSNTGADMLAIIINFALASGTFVLAATAVALVGPAEASSKSRED